jgi:hypothetical protein
VSKVVSDKSGRLTSTSNKRAKKTITSCISKKFISRSSNDVAHEGYHEHINTWRYKKQGTASFPDSEAVLQV